MMMASVGAPDLELINTQKEENPLQLGGWLQQSTSEDKFMGTHVGAVDLADKVAQVYTQQ